jgi:hypothetical protein
MIRRFVYDADLDAIVELGEFRSSLSADERYTQVENDYRSTPQLERDAPGRRLRNEALERADRRVFAHKRLGDEKRWTET